MTRRTWLDALAHELAACGVSAVEAAAIVVEAEGHLVEAPAAPLEAFGPPSVYGAGKSTLLRVLAGVLRPDAGEVDVLGTIGYASQRGGLFDHLLPAEHFVLFGRPRGLTRRAAVAEGRRLTEQLGWDPLAAPVVGSLSGGTRQKLTVVLAALGGPDVLLLDEPYQGLDRDSVERFRELLGVALAMAATYLSIVAIDRQVDDLVGIALMLGVTACTSVALGTALGALVARELEGALALFILAGLQFMANPPSPGRGA